jgi:hypothetical protein
LKYYFCATKFSVDDVASGVIPTVCGAKIGALLQAFGVNLNVIEFLSYVEAVGVSTFQYATDAIHSDSGTAVNLNNVFPSGFVADF